MPRGFYFWLGVRLSHFSGISSGWTVYAPAPSKRLNMSSIKIETICLDPESDVSWEHVMDMSIGKLVSFRKRD